MMGSARFSATLFLLLLASVQQARGATLWLLVGHSQFRGGYVTDAPTQPQPVSPVGFYTTPFQTLMAGAPAVSGFDIYLKDFLEVKGVTNQRILPFYVNSAGVQSLTGPGWPYADYSAGGVLRPALLAWLQVILQANLTATGAARISEIHVVLSDATADMIAVYTGIRQDLSGLALAYNDLADSIAVVCVAHKLKPSFGVILNDGQYLPGSVLALLAPSANAQIQQFVAMRTDTTAISTHGALLEQDNTHYLLSWLPNLVKPVVAAFP